MSLLSSAVVAVANAEIGYLEKASNADLDSKTGNAGDKNYTKYARDLGVPNGGDNYWCQVFVNWCFVKAFGETGAEKLLYGQKKNMSTISEKDVFNGKGRLVNLSDAKPGDIVWRSRKGGGHVGLVVGNQGGQIITVEGNTSVNDASAWNGGGVARHVGGEWTWCGRPEFDGVGNLSAVAYAGGALVENAVGKVVDGVGGFISSVGDAISDAWNAIGEAAQACISGISNWIGNIASIFNKPSYTLKHQEFKINYQEVTEEIIKDEIKTVNIDDLGNGGYTNLLSYPSLVETPFIILKVGNYTFGKYTEQGSANNKKVNYPNYIDSMSVRKINGQVNQYTIELTYQIAPGDDPNMLDKIFSSVGYGKVYISYGDYASPSYIYKEEEAIMTKITTQVDFNGSSIKYSVQCTSSAALLAASAFNFPAGTFKPSDKIKQLLTDKTYGLTDVFTGMQNMTMVAKNNLIPSDDAPVEIEAKNSMDALSYLQYLVSCMSSSTNGSEDPIRDSTYHMTIYDDNFGDLNMKGCYFKITKVYSSAKALATQNTFDLDIGYPSDNQVMSFSVNTDNSWSLLYNYTDSIVQPQYTYTIDNKGNLITQYSPNLMTSAKNNKMTETQKAWWTQMTQFPVAASVTIKGLVRPAILMTYIRVNAMFFGQRHVSSGLYIITGQEDRIDEQGFRTTLALTRIAGDGDYIQRTKTTVTSKIPVSVDVTTSDIEVSLVTKRSAVAGAVESDMSGTDQVRNAGGYVTGSSGTGAMSGAPQQVTGGAPYSYNDDTCMRIAAAMCTEQGFGTSADSIVALKWETSLLCNLFEKYPFPVGSTLTDFIFSGSWNKSNREKFGITNNLSSIASFFASTAANAYMNVKAVGQPFTFTGSWSGTGTVTQAMVQAVKEVVVGGKRYTNADEQGCDFGYLECNGTVIEGRDAYKQAKTSRPELFIPGVTKLQVVWKDGSKGAKSTFLGFPANNPKFDAFCKRG